MTMALRLTGAKLVARRGTICTICLGLVLAGFGHDVIGSARADEWTAFEQRTQRGEEADHTCTQTRRVDYYHRRDLSVDNFALLVDGFLDFLDAELIPISPGRRFKVFVSPSADQHKKDAAAFFGAMKPSSFGTYYSKYDVLATHAMTGPGTVTSLLVYPVMHEYIPGTPAWTRTVIATFFEKSYGYPGSDGKLTFKVGYHNPWRITEVAGCLDRLDLAQIVSNPNYADGQSHYRLLGTFLWQQGKLNAFIARLHDRDLRGWENYIAAAFERPMSEILPLWRDYLASVDADWYGIERTPLSQIYSSAAEFEAAIAKTSRRATWHEWLVERVMRRWLIPPFCPIKESVQTGAASQSKSNSR
jgi:hypothetical protein